MAGRGYSLRRPTPPPQDPPADPPPPSRSWWRRTRDVIHRFAVWQGWTSLTAIVTTIAAVGALWFTSQSLRAALDVAVTDRFQKAADLLSKDNIDARVSGIYLFERLARDSPADHSVVFTVLLEFVRANSPRSECDQISRNTTAVGQPEAKRGPSDISAALIVIGRRDASRDAFRLELTNTCLAYGELDYAQWSGASFTGSVLLSANLTGADLSDASVVEADLTGAYLSGANLSRAILYGANLTGAVLAGANLDRASLSCRLPLDRSPVCTNLQEARLSCLSEYGADGDGIQQVKAQTCASLVDADLNGANLHSAWLDGANLTGARIGCESDDRDRIRCADLTDASLAGANLTRADLDGANLTNIYYNDMTVWPAGFTPPPSRPER
ncbi:pentapeptide repeat-containing protein [Nocardia sp. NPDC127526]|uniref:pentapeptide repeat-containing protein n=1 Tax=Nocardia sp. NPDC127526 TaxID=3345393 RepID=UPI0036451485